MVVCSSVFICSDLFLSLVWNCIGIWGGYGPGAGYIPITVLDIRGPKIQFWKKEDWRGMVLILLKTNVKSTNPVNALFSDVVCNRHGEFVFPSLFPIKSPIRASHLARGWRVLRYRRMICLTSRCPGRGSANEAGIALTSWKAWMASIWPVFAVSWIYEGGNAAWFSLMLRAGKHPKMSSLALPLWVPTIARCLWFVVLMKCHHCSNYQT